MKNVLLIISLFLTSGAFGQKENKMAPAYFISGEITSIDSFNRVLLGALPDFHLTAMDTSRMSAWDFNFTNNEIYDNSQNELHIAYKIEVIGGNPALRIPNKYGIGDIQVTGQFLTLTKIYNRLFNSNILPEDLQKRGPVYGPIVWPKTNYWFRFESGTKGYSMFFRKL